MGYLIYSAVIVCLLSLVGIYYSRKNKEYQNSFSQRTGRRVLKAIQDDPDGWSPAYGGYGPDVWRYKEILVSAHAHLDFIVTVTPGDIEIQGDVARDIQKALVHMNFVHINKGLKSLPEID